MTAWSVLGLFAGVLLLGYAFLDMTFAGDMGLAMDSDNPHPRVDRVRYSLAGFTYLHGDRVLTGPHRSLPLTLGWLALTAGLMLSVWRRWGLMQARQALRAGLTSLALVVVVGAPVLGLATWKHNGLLRTTPSGLSGQPVSMTHAWPLTLHLWRCTRWVENQGCQDHEEATFPNPTAWALLGVFVTAGAGLWRGSERNRRS
ncbi:hypothetical protein [Deinococcus aestuarii]|uniref:hypothetical protein n=1 Tax=Deinococcus aestuarii TaxID=2774531 RepID=UPI001C0D8BE9|nr:hypothetical protein [Deinococcus aestuarii]